MGKRGPKPTPTVILDARGSWLAPLRAGEIEPEPDDGEMPPGLGPYGEQMWQAIYGDLQADKLVATRDRGALITTIKAWDQYCRISNELDAYVADHNGSWMLRTGTGSFKANPLIAVQRSAMQDYRAGCALFGLSPSSRVGLPAVAASPGSAKSGKKETELERFTRQKAEATERVKSGGE